MTTTQDNDTVQEIAKTTLRQLCGGPTGRIKAMIGGKNFVVDGSNPARVTTSFHFPNRRGANRCAVTYHHGTDLYSMKLTRVRKIPHAGYVADVLHEQDGMYCDMLKSYFEMHTGLYLSL